VAEFLILFSQSFKSQKLIVDARSASCTATKSRNNRYE